VQAKPPNPYNNPFHQIPIPTPPPQQQNTTPPKTNSQKTEAKNSAPSPHQGPLFFCAQNKNENSRSFFLNGFVLPFAG
jgi:hypothetical protein